MSKSTAAELRVLKALGHVLPPSVIVEHLRDGGRWNFRINGIPVQAAWIGEGWAADVRVLLSGGVAPPDIVVARRMSKGARKTAADAGIGWIDETGAAEIALPSVIVSRTGRTVERKSSWTGSVCAVAEALLVGTTATVQEMRRTTGLSSGSCASSLRFLQARGLLDAEAERGRRSGRRLVDFDELLNEFAKEAGARPRGLTLAVGAPWNDPLSRLRRIGSAWESAGLSWACTGVAAAAVLAPLLSDWGSAEVYVDSNTMAGLEAAARKANLEPVEGGRLVLHPFPTPATKRLAAQMDELRVAPWPRVFADLRKRGGVRAEEAADHLKDVMREA